MCTRSMFRRAARLLVTIALLTLSGEFATAHKAHKKPKVEPTTVAEPATTVEPTTVAEPAPTFETPALPDPGPAASLAPGSAPQQETPVLRDESPAVEVPAPLHDHADHDHAKAAIGANPDARSSEADTRQRVSLLEWIGRLHPIMIHFPIGLLISAFLAEMMFAVTGSMLFRHSVRFMLWGGALSTVPVACLGWAFAATGPTEQGWILETHRWLGTSTAIASLMALAMLERAERADFSRTPLRIGLALVAAMTGATGFFGGSLLYGIDHLSGYTQ